MVSLTPATPAQLRLRFVLGAFVVMFLAVSQGAEAQGLVQGVQQGAEAGNKAAGPVGGVLGGAIGGVVGVFNGVLGVGGEGGAAPANNAGANNAKQSQTAPGKGGKKGAKAASTKSMEVLPQPGEPQLTAEQIVTNSDANIDRIKAELKLTAEQEKHWGAFHSAMNDLVH